MAQYCFFSLFLTTSRSFSFYTADLVFLFVSLVFEVLTGESDWPIWIRKIRDLLDYHEGVLDTINGRLVKPEHLAEEATEDEKNEHKQKSDLYRKANS